MEALEFVCPHIWVVTCASSAVYAAAAEPVDGRTCITLTAGLEKAEAFQISAQRTTFEMTGSGAMHALYRRDRTTRSLCRLL